MIENREGTSSLRRAFLGGIMAYIFVVSPFQQAYAGFADKADKNVRIMIEATRKLDYALPENRSYLLVKNETIETERKRLVDDAGIPHHETTTGLDGVAHPRSKPFAPPSLREIADEKTVALAQFNVYSPVH